MAFSICMIPEFNNGMIESEDKGPLLATLMKTPQNKGEFIIFFIIYF